MYYTFPPADNCMLLIYKTIMSCLSFPGSLYSISVTRTAGNFAWEFVRSKISVIVSGRVCNVHPRVSGTTMEVWIQKTELKLTYLLQKNMLLSSAV